MWFTVNMVSMTKILFIICIIYEEFKNRRWLVKSILLSPLIASLCISMCLVLRCSFLIIFFLAKVGGQLWYLTIVQFFSRNYKKLKQKPLVLSYRIIVTAVIIEIIQIKYSNSLFNIILYLQT